MVETPDLIADIRSMVAEVGTTSGTLFLSKAAMKALSDEDRKQLNQEFPGIKLSVAPRYKEPAQ